MAEVKERVDEEPIWPRAPTLERFHGGEAVFVRGVIDQRGVALSTMFGEVYVSVSTRSASGMTECGSRPISAVTRADAYVPADEFVAAMAALSRADAALAGIRDAIEAGGDVFAAINAILNPPPSEDEDGW